MGDIVLTTPVPRLLKKKFPNSNIHFITKDEYSYIYDNNINVDKVIKFKDNPIEILTQLRSEKYDLVVDLHNNLRSNFIKLFLLKTSITYKKYFFKRWLLTNLKIKLKIKHIAKSYIETLLKINIYDDGEGLDFYFSKKRKEIKLPSIYNNGFIVVVVGAKHKTKRLTSKKLIELCDKINGPIVLVGGKSEIPISKKLENFFNYSDLRIRDELNKNTYIYNLCGKLNIEESAYIIKMSDKVFTHDTGLMHIASALKKKIFSIFGSTHSNLGFYPFRTSFSVIENNNLSCRPCTKIGYAKCPAGHFKCMKDLKFDDVS
jgi:ADP-heptose:LPS heptosyltransferase